MLLLGFLLGHQSSKAPAAAAVAFQELGQVHERLAQQRGAEVPALDARSFSESLSRLTQFSVQPVDLRPEDTKLAGGTCEVLNGVPVACLHYDWEGHRVSLFQVDERRASYRALRDMGAGENYVARRDAGVSYVAWQSRGLQCVLVSREMPMHRLFQLACHACERLEGKRS